jgi:hypothetical protein
MQDFNDVSKIITVARDQLARYKKQLNAMNYIEGKDYRWQHDRSGGASQLVFEYSWNYRKFYSRWYRWVQ